MFLTVPTGVSAVVQRSGATIGEWKPGMHFAPPQYRVVAMTPRQACTFNYDVLACPTKDNVMVEVDVTLVFRITSATEFVYKLGACKFDEGLKAVAEEAIRSMVRLIPHHNIYELRGSGADELLSVLNDKFSMFGISFVNATITDVKLPSEVAEALQNSTMVDQRLREHERKHEFQLKLVHDKHDLELKDLILSNERFEQSMNADMERTSIDLDAKCLEVDRKRKLAAIEASKLQSVALKNAEANLANDAVKAETAAQVSINKAKADAARKRLETEHHSQHSIIRSEARLVEAEAASRRLKIEAGRRGCNRRKAEGRPQPLSQRQSHQEPFGLGLQQPHYD